MRTVYGCVAMSVGLCTLRDVLTTDLAVGAADTGEVRGRDGGGRTRHVEVAKEVSAD